MSRRKPPPDIKAATHKPDEIESAIRHAIEKCLGEGIQLSPARAARRSRRLIKLAQAPAKGTSDAGRPKLDHHYRRAVDAIVVAINKDRADSIQIDQRNGLPRNLDGSVQMILVKARQSFEVSGTNYSAWWTAMWLSPSDDGQDCEDLRRAVGAISRLAPGSLRRRMRSWRANSVISAR